MIKYYPFQSQEEVPPPSRVAYAITTHDTNEIGTYEPRGIWVGGAGAITYRPIDNAADVVISGVPAGTFLPICPSHIRATGTTATLMVALV